MELILSAFGVVILCFGVAYGLAAAIGKNKELERQRLESREKLRASIKAIEEEASPRVKKVLVDLNKALSNHEFSEWVESYLALSAMEKNEMILLRARWNAAWREHYADARRRGDRT